MPSEAFEKGMDNLRGRILGLIESWGVDPRQERAIKSTFKALTYDLQAKVNDAIRDELESR
jgi:hypothetical protein